MNVAGSKATGLDHAVFIRNVIVGRRGLTQSVLLEAFARAGAVRARSLIATGNVVCSLEDVNPTAFLERVRAALLEAVELQEPLFLRGALEMRAIGQNGAFEAVNLEEVYERTVTFLSAPVAPGLEFPSPARGDLEVCLVTPLEVYSVTCLVGGRPGNVNAFLEKHLNQRCTTRNWNTVLRVLGWMNR